jgi:hypothetical protein
MLAETDYAEIALSFLEYKATYREPIFEAWDRKGMLAIAIFRALREWGVELENISTRPDSADISEIQITVDLLNREARFSVGIGAVNLFVINPHLKEPGISIGLARAGLEAVLSSANASLDKQLLTKAVHVSPQGRPIHDITSKFVRLDSHLKLGENVRAYGFSVYTENGSWVVDASGLYPEALFIRLSRTFGAEVTFETLVDWMNTDEKSVLELLQLRLE